MGICSVAIDVGEVIIMFISVRQTEKGVANDRFTVEKCMKTEMIMTDNDDNFALIKKQIFG